jgi:hypothetical protein
LEERLSNMKLYKTIRDEIRRVIAIHAIYNIYQKSQMKQKAMFDMLEDTFHGNEAKGIVSQLKQVICGQPPFDGLYDKKVNVVTSDSLTNVTSLVLKKDLIQSEQVLMAGRDIT